MICILGRHAIGRENWASIVEIAQGGARHNGVGFGSV